jgi:hypothetical protein
MTPDFIIQMRAEKADLQRKLEAIDAVIAAYCAEEPAVDEAPQRPSIRVLPRPLSLASRERLPLARFSDYGQSVIRAAMNMLPASNGTPVPTRELLEVLEVLEVEVRGNDKANALSALLSRSADLMNHGRRGWTLAAQAPRGVPPMPSPEQLNQEDYGEL